MPSIYHYSAHTEGERLGRIKLEKRRATAKMLTERAVYHAKMKLKKVGTNLYMVVFVGAFVTFVGAGLYGLYNPKNSRAHPFVDRVFYVLNHNKFITSNKVLGKPLKLLVSDNGT